MLHFFQRELLRLAIFIDLVEGRFRLYTPSCHHGCKVRPWCRTLISCHELFELLDGILIDRIAHGKHLLPQGLQERKSSPVVTDDVLALLQAMDMVLEDDLFTRLGCLLGKS